jgi:hypothetical protein
MLLEYTSIPPTMLKHEQHALFLLQGAGVVMASDAL